MNTFKLSLAAFSRIFGYLLLSVLLISCSDDEQPQPEYDHAHSNIDMKKHPFEHQFAQQCITRETANSINKDVDTERFTKPCMCIAKYLMADLTAVESEKLLTEKKHTQSLRIRYETAAYNCLQKKQNLPAPKIFELQ